MITRITNLTDMTAMVLFIGIIAGVTIVGCFLLSNLRKIDWHNKSGTKLKESLKMFLTGIVAAVIALVVYIFIIR